MLLKKQVTQTQAELKGEAGELDLYAKLTEAFPEDQFRRQTRGTSTGDIIQRIRTKTGIIDIPIVYDNKQAESISAGDIAKAKKYQEIHGTKYVLIAYLRDAILELSLMSKSDEERVSKEAMLYQYIRSQEFTSRIEQLARIQTKIWQSQDKEEKDHQKMWKERREYFTQSDRQQAEITTKIQDILSQQQSEVQASAKKSSMVIENRERRSDDNYNMGQIMDFFTHIEKRDITYLSEFLAFPPPGMQNSDTKIILEKSCVTVKEILLNVARDYKELYGFYTAYKHGYRIIQGQLNGSIDIITYIENDGSQKYFEIYNTDVEEIKTLSKQCSIILDCIFSNHHERNLRESNPLKSTVQIKTVIKGGSNYKKEGLSILYPTRGDRMREEELQSDKIYAEIFDYETENKNKGK